MPDWVIAVILGIVEGVTEFLPVSSTGHLVVVGYFIGLPETLKNTFEIVIQLGAVFAVIAYYWADLFGQLKTVKNDKQVQHFWLAILVAFMPAAVFGLLFDDMIEAVLFRPVPIAIALIVGGLVFLWVEHVGLAEKSEQIEATNITLRQALMVGLFQTLALVPGVSRSGASIIGGLVVGLSRYAATQFSFYLAIPTLGAATVYVFVNSLDTLSSGNLVNLLIGTVVSGIVAWWSIGWLLRFISKNSFALFGYYRIAVGSIILILVFVFGL